MSLLIRRFRLTRPRACSIFRPSVPNLSRNFAISSSGSSQGVRPDPQQLNAEDLGENNSQRPARKLGSASGLKALRSKTKKQTNEASAEIAPRTILGQSADLPIRARFAPSPTGYLHLGSLRTALFNKLAVTASKGGAFILRIEDTDQSRLVKDAEERLLNDLEWAGLSWDEGPDKGGPYGPYRQSERLPIYKEHVQKLLDKGHAYRCFCSSEQLESQKRELHEAGKPTLYPGTCRSIDTSESNRRSNDGEAHVVRFKGEAFGRPKLRDAIYGPFQKKDLEEDFILMKTDGFPTYHLANVVDDHLMKITHVIRGEEWLISTPKHIALYEAFGWQPPTFAHLGLLVDTDGSKLSKRNDSVNVSKYRNSGIFPMALLAWLANLGSSFKPDVQPPRTIDDISNALTFKFTRGGIKLNLAKLDHFNVKYRDSLLVKIIPQLAEKEAELIDKHLTQPMLREIEAITNGGLGDRELAGDLWRNPLELVPALANEVSKAGYVYKVLASQQTGFQSPTSLILQHPYLFWRVPTEKYRTSLEAYGPDERILDALEEAVVHGDDWGDGSKVMHNLHSKLGPQGVDQLTIHNVVRLVGAGGQDVVSQSSSKMFMLLGRDEWKYRTGVVRSILHG